jgi:hypothetical protein
LDYKNFLAFTSYVMSLNLIIKKVIQWKLFP